MDGLYQKVLPTRHVLSYDCEAIKCGSEFWTVKNNKSNQ